MAKVSFVVIGYNIESYISRCLKSIINQTLKDIEVIFVDDGSTDDTIKVVNNFKDNRIIVISQENQGANSARKTGFKASKSDYIVFIDGDDWIDENLAKELYAIATKDNYDIVCYNHFLAYDDRTIIKKQQIYEDIKGSKYLELLLSQKISHNLWNKFYKREFLHNSNFECIDNITMGDDLVANVKLAVNSPKVIMLDNSYYYYYQRVSSVTKKISSKTLEIEKAILSVENILDEKNILSKYREYINYLWFRHCYYCFVVLSRHKISYVQKRLYKIWNSKNINIKKNKFCVEYIHTIPYSKRILLLLYNINYYLGYIFARGFILIKDMSNQK